MTNSKFCLYKGFAVGFLEEDEAHARLDFQFPDIHREWATVNRSSSPENKSASRCARMIETQLTFERMSLAELDALIEEGHPQAETLLRNARTELAEFIRDNGRFEPHSDRDWAESGDVYIPDYVPQMA